MKRISKNRRWATRLAHDDQGVSAMEFAMVFPLFFLVLYAIVTYSLIYVAQQSLTLTAEEGARAALRYQAGSTTIAQALAVRVSATCTAASGLTGWLGAHQPTCTATAASCSFDATMQCISVAVTYNYAAYPLVPTLPLLSLALPTQLAAHATVQINPNTLL